MAGLSPEQVAEAAVRYRAGESLGALAARFGVARKTVARRLRRAGVEVRAPGGRPGLPPPRLRPEEVAAAADQYRAGRPLEAVAAAFGVHRDTLRRALRAAGVATRPAGHNFARLSPGDRAGMADRYRAGETIEAIAARFGTTPSGVWRRLARDGVPIRPRGSTPAEVVAARLGRRRTGG